MADAAQLLTALSGNREALLKYIDAALLRQNKWVEQAMYGNMDETYPMGSSGSDSCFASVAPVSPVAPVQHSAPRVMSDSVRRGKESTRSIQFRNDVKDSIRKTVESEVEVRWQPSIGNYSITSIFDHISYTRDQHCRQPTRMSKLEKKHFEKARQVGTQMKKVPSTISLHSLSGLSGVSNCFSSITSRREFDIFTFILILSNVILVGCETQFVAFSDDGISPDIFQTLDHIYTILFCIELLLRMGSEGISFFTSMSNRLWNMFDVFIVLSAVFGSLATLFQSSDGQDSTHLRMVRILRITRLLRTFRLMRLVRFLRALRTLTNSIAATLKSVFWAFVLMAMIFYGFGVAFTQAVSDYRVDAGLPNCHNDYTCDENELTASFGDLSRSMYVLFVVVTGGVDWYDVAKPLYAIGFVWIVLFTIFQAFMLFAVLNVLTGMFCQSAIESTQLDKELAAMHMMANKNAHIDAMNELFKEIDEDRSGHLTLLELEQALSDERIQAYFSSLEIDASDAWTLFRLLDTEGCGCIEVDDFVCGCLSLKGQAKAVHVAKINQDSHRLRTLVEDSFDMIMQRLEAIRPQDKRSNGFRKPSTGKESFVTTPPPPPSLPDEDKLPGLLTHLQ
eukprot:TRINITY_DN15187_c0_g2_i1.p1 TRINITY_DN15187_c0_g2~~TRINITY_DN15187_c0_g2_i1.p1  ORF type:complete len:620 (+),score=60.16 TRINITY_DN15187_c0_g2_i1:98-1957(+)